ncbi:CHAT domain-containing protein [Nostoc sp. CHAB 5836]|nr:CHAT domain-containing protein [Nostoc sp. CHAB 5836]
MKMGLRRWMVIFVIALLLCVSQPFWLSFPLIFGSSVVVGQTNDSRKVEADRLLQQGTQQRQAEQYNAALKSFQQALIIYREIKVSREVKALQGKVLQEIGHAYFQLGDNAKAIDYLQQAIVTAQEIKHRLNEGVALATLGLVYSKLQDDAKAIDYYNQSLVIAREIQNSQLETLAQTLLEATQSRSNARIREARLLYSQAVKQYNNSQFEAALQTFQQALIIYQEIRDRYKEGNVLNFIGVTYRKLGNYTKAIKSLEESLVIATEIQSPQIEEYALNNLGNVYVDLGDYIGAIEYFQRDLKITRERLKNPKGEENTLNNIANAYIELGDYVRAIEYYQQALTIAREAKNSEGEGATLNNLGLVYLYLGDYIKSMWYSQQSLAIAQNTKDPGLEGAARGNLGTVYSKLGNYSKAFDYYNHVLTIARKIKDPVMEGKMQGNIGSIHFDLGQWYESIKYYQQWLTSAKNIRDRQSEVGALNGLGTVYLFLEDYIQSIEYFRQALILVKEIQDRRNEGMVLNNLGFAFYKSGNLAAASETLIEAIQVRESLRSRLSEDNDKVSIFEQYRNSFGNLETVLIDQNQTDAALEISERGRARAFVELILSRLPTTSKIEVKSPTIKQIQQIAKAEKATLVQYSIFKIQGKLRGKESKLYIWVIKPTGEIKFQQVDLKSILQKENTTLEELVENIRDSIGVRDRSIFTRTNSTSQNTTAKRDQFAIKVFPSPNDDPSKDLQKLHEILIDPIADLLPTDPNERVIFIPQNELFLVPFPALKDAQGKYLIEKHTILTAPSIQVLGLTHERAKEVKRASVQNALVVGNPDMPSVAPKIGDEAQPLSKLPGAEKEAEAITPLLEENKLKTKLLRDKQATKAAVLKLLPQAKIIHLATHGLFDNIQGLQSAIALAPLGKDNGLLTAEEILKLRLNSDLVVLSACNTGRGRITGDGVIGLSRSLISAGTPSVIVSLWAVPDAPTAELMTEFYKHLLNKQKPLDKAQALRQAMLKFKDKPPKDWAAFTLIGESNQVTN